MDFSLLLENSGSEPWWSVFASSQFLGLVMTTFFTMLLLLTLYFGVIKKQKNGEAPTNKIMVLLEFYFVSFTDLLDNVMMGKNKWSQPYLFTLFNFILFNSLIPWLGFEAAPSTLMFTFPLTLITFIIIYVIGIGTMGLIGFVKHKYKNPMEIVLQFTPLLSMSVRLFAATLAGAVIGNIIWVIVGGVTSTSSSISNITLWFPAIQGSWKWVWSIADTALSALQAFVFIMLTAIFWTMETGDSWSAKERKMIREKKKALIEKGNLRKETTVEIYIGDENGQWKKHN